MTKRPTGHDTQRAETERASRDPMAESVPCAWCGNHHSRKSRKWMASRRFLAYCSKKCEGRKHAAMAKAHHHARKAAGLPPKREYQKTRAEILAMNAPRRALGWRPVCGDCGDLPDRRPEDGTECTCGKVFAEREPVTLEVPYTSSMALCLDE